LRPRSLSFLVLVALALLVTSQAVRAAGTPPATQIEGAASCGTTTAEQIAAARKALAATDARSERAALACLIEATRSLDEKLDNYQQGRPAAGALHVPQTDFPIPPLRQ